MITLFALYTELWLRSSEMADFSSGGGKFSLVITDNLKYKHWSYFSALFPMQ
jgi:hypothetical protein